jgi:ADP-dependent glucokinase
MAASQVLVGVSVVVLLLSWLLQPYLLAALDASALKELQAAQGGVAVRLQRVAVGYNSNADLIVRRATALYELLHLSPQSSSSDHELIKSRQDLADVASHFFAKGAAAERFVVDDAFFDEIVAAARRTDGVESFIGGNAPLMGERFAKHGVNVLLGGHVGSTLRSMLNPAIEVPPPAPGAKSDDEVHLIAEYAKGSEWGGLVAPRANRLILVHDLTNARLLPLEAFHAAIEGAKAAPELVVIAGLHLLEAEPEAFWHSRLQEVVAALRRLRQPLHLELASVGSPRYLALLARTVLPEVDSLGLNEQELHSLYVALGGADVRPEALQGVSAAEAVLLHVLASPAAGTRLARIHLHSLPFHLLALRRGPEGSRQWEASRALGAVAAASLAGTLHACEGQLGPDAAAVLPGVPTHPRSYTAQGNSAVQFFYAPVLVCHKPKRTVGLGDIISATGLAYHF